MKESDQINYKNDVLFINNNYKSKYRIFQTNIFIILSSFTQILLKYDILLITLITLLIRFCVGIGSYSGKGTPPMFGDFEAQRHWMEITLNLPMKDWYFYDLQYWGLDYPIITAYHSLIMGYIGQYVFGGNKHEWFTLESSRGQEDVNLKSFMRFTVCFTDLVLYIPAVIWFAKNYDRLSNTVVSSSNSKIQKIKSISYKSITLNHLKQLIHSCNSIILLMQPSLLIIDHGHFQYNGCMLGFVLVAINYILDDKLGFACFFFVCSLCFKQMSLYYMPVIAIYMLKNTLLSWKFLEFIMLGVITVSTFVIFYAPLLFFSDYKNHGFGVLVQAFARVFPFDRGLFEGKVANFWCVSNVLIKYKTKFTNDQLKLYALILTVVAISPSLFFVMFKKNQYDNNKRKKLLIYALSSCSLSFYLFAFQVHEKSILLPMLPLTLLFCEYNNIGYPRQPENTKDIESKNFNITILSFIQNVAMFSLWPLLKEDKLVLQFFILTVFFNWLVHGSLTSGSNTRTKFQWLSNCFINAVYIAMALNIALDIFVHPIMGLPDIWVILNCFISFVCFIIIYLWLLVKMYNL